MKESTTKKLYIINGWGGPSNISSSSDYNTWNNTLNGGTQNGGMAFGLATNTNGDVFIGTETQGVMRSDANGTSAFETVSPIGGNSSVFVDPYSGFVFGSVPNNNSSIYLYGSVPADNGTNMFSFEDFPEYTGPNAMVFDNRGNLYMTANSGNFASSGFYISPSPWHTKSVFTKIMANANVSYYFTSMYIDECGYILGAQAGAGIYMSSSPVNTPALCVLDLPKNGTIGASVTPTLSWTHICNPDSFRLQISTYDDFNDLIVDSTFKSTINFNVEANTLATQKQYFWRVYAINQAGNGSWSIPFSFKTGNSTNSIDIQKSTTQLFLTPNPAKSHISINVEDHLIGEPFCIVNNIGISVMQGVIQSKKNTISVQKINPGMYFVQIGKAKELVLKFVKID
jgi:hypothetical protein